MNKTEFSIIIPVFNGEKYIKECIESAVSQSFKGKYEIIVVNDGSEDKTEEIIKKFDDKKINVYKNKNGGLAYSRNFGNSKAKGKYIIYLDADDYLDKNALQIFYDKNKAKDKADVILAPYYAKREHKGDLKLYFPLKNFAERQGFINIENTDGEILNTNFEAWGKAYKRDFILKKNVQSPIIHLAEDLPLFYKVFASSEKILLCKKPVYFYRKGHKQPYAKGRRDWIEETIKAILTSEEEAKKYKNFSLIEKHYAKNALKVCTFWMKEFRKLENKDKFYKFACNYLEKFGLRGKFCIKVFFNNLIDILQNKN